VNETTNRERRGRDFRRKEAEFISVRPERAMMLFRGDESQGIEGTIRVDSHH